MDTLTKTDRMHFIGGSDIAGILGLSRYKTPLSVWAEKTGQLPDIVRDELAVKLGRRLEEVVAELYVEKTHERVQRATEHRVHPQYPHFAAQIDRLIVGKDELLECKTTSAWKAKEWADDEIPQEYICQVMWQLACSGRRRGHIAALIGNQDFRIKTVDRDPVMIAEMLKRADKFWNEFVIPKVMPMQILAQDTDTLARLFPTAEPETKIDLGDDAAKLTENRNASIQDIKQLEKTVEQIENILKAQMQTHEAASAGKWKIFWKDVTREAYEVPASKGRRFTIRENKGE